jgi:hypothetical protein
MSEQVLTSMADPLIDDAALAEIRLAYGSHADMQLVLRELDRLKAHNAYLTDIFYGIADLKRCEEHRRMPVSREEYDFTIDPGRCEVCRANDLRAMVAGNPQATTMARHLEASRRRSIHLYLENRRLREQQP